jgi:RNA polymerase sigma factor (sigma-70 family)
VCRRFLADSADVDDAFQATFLVLLRKARSLRKRELVANWLYGVACRTALRAKTDAARRRFRERQIMPKNAYAPDEGPVQRDLRALLDHEIGRLPAKLRLPILLCYLEGLTLAEAARQLGWPAGTVSGRLARARELLRTRLARRGVAVSAAGVSGALAESSQAAVPTTLKAATLNAATSLTAKQMAAVATISAPIAALTEGVLKAMFLTKLNVCLAVVGIAVVMSASGTVLHQRLSNAAAATTQESAPQATTPPKDVAQARVNEDAAWQDAMEKLRLAIPPVPGISEEKAKSLLENSRTDDKMKALLRAQFQAADAEARALWHEFQAGKGALDRLIRSFEHLSEAERALSDKKENHVLALQHQLKRLRAVEMINQERFDAGRIPVQELAEPRFYRLQAEIRLARALIPEGLDK